MDWDNGAPDLTREHPVHTKTIQGRGCAPVWEQRTALSVSMRLWAFLCTLVKATVPWYASCLALFFYRHLSTGLNAAIQQSRGRWQHPRHRDKGPDDEAGFTVSWTLAFACLPVVWGRWGLTHTNRSILTAAVTVPCFLDQPLLCLTVCKSAFWWQLPVLSCSPINTDREGTFNRQGGRHCWLSAVSLRMTPCLAVINNRLCVSTHRHGPWSRPHSLLWCSWQLRHGYPRRRSPVSRATLQGGSVGDVTYEPAVKAILSPPPPLSLFQCIEMLTHWVLGLYCLVGSDRGF